MAGSAARLRRGTTVVPQPEATADGALVERARNGDDRAFRLLVERYEPRVAATAIGMLGAGPDAEDVGQETFIRFYRSLDRFRGDSALATYLTRIAVNLSLTALKRRKSWRGRYVRPPSPQDRPPGSDTLPAPGRDSDVDWTATTGPDIHHELERRMLIDRVRRAIDTLNPSQRAVVVLRLIDGYSTRETADILEVPPGTIMSRLSRAMRKLEDILETHDEP